MEGFAHHERTDYLILQLVLLVVVGVFYIRRQLKQEAPLLPVDLMRIPIFALSVGTSICSFTAQMLALVSLPFLLQNMWGRSEVATGLLLTPWPVATLFTAPLAGYLVEKIHAGLLGCVGMLVFAAGLSAAPANRSGGASGMIGTARLLGQTLGATLVALLFNLTNAQPHTFASLFVGIGFAAVAAVVSCLRLSQQMPLKRREP